MNELCAKDPLHGVTLEMILTRLVAHLGWKEMARVIEIRCFMFDPSITSSLKFLRRTPWARKKTEELYLRCNLHLASPAKHAKPAPSKP